MRTQRMLALLQLGGVALAGALGAGSLKITSDFDGSYHAVSQVTETSTWASMTTATVNVGSAKSRRAQIIKYEVEETTVIVKDVTMMLEVMSSSSPNLQSNGFADSACVVKTLSLVGSIVESASSVGQTKSAATTTVLPTESTPGAEESPAINRYGVHNKASILSASTPGSTSGAGASPFTSTRDIRSLASTTGPTAEVSQSMTSRASYSSDSISPSAFLAASSTSASAINTTVPGPSDAVTFCPNLNGETWVDEKHIEHTIMCNTRFNGTSWRLGPKQALAPSLMDCILYCEAQPSCVGSALDSEGCTLYSSLSNYYPAPGVDFASQLKFTAKSSNDSASTTASESPAGRPTVTMTSFTSLYTTITTTVTAPMVTALYNQTKNGTMTWRRARDLMPEFSSLSTSSSKKALSTSKRSSSISSKVPSSTSSRHSSSSSTKSSSSTSKHSSSTSSKRLLSTTKHSTTTTVTHISSLADTKLGNKAAVTSSSVSSTSSKPSTTSSRSASSTQSTTSSRKSTTSSSFKSKTSTTKKTSTAKKTSTTKKSTTKRATTTTRSTTTSTTSSITTVTAPAPTQPGIVSGCIEWHVAVWGEYCSLVADEYDISVDTFMAWNPAVNAPYCNEMWAGDAYCVGISSSSAASTTASTTLTKATGTTLTTTTGTSKTTTTASTSKSTMTTSTSQTTTTMSSATSAATAAPNGYVMYTGNGTVAAGWPSQSEWVTFDEMWAYNEPIMLESCENEWGVPNDSADEVAEMQAAILSISSSSGVDPRFILAIIMQESTGCVRVITTEWSVRNPGLMQTHDGAGTCNDDDDVQTPCPDSEITQMIQDGTEGTATGDGLVQCLQETGVTDVSMYYRAARIYNGGLGGYNADNLGSGCCTLCYSSDVANRLTGWHTGTSACTL